VNPGGLAVLAAVLVGATAFGLYRRRTDGRLTGSLPIQGLDVGRGGDAGSGPGAYAVSIDDADDRLSADDLGIALGQRATLVQFSSAFCAPCRATRSLLGDVAQTVDGVAYVEVDAESHLDLVRRHSVMRTPTVFVLDGTGRVVRRAVGLPRKPEVLAALGEAIP
jgi:thiol-disulfide isomerase/thioredoxin